MQENTSYKEAGLFSLFKTLVYNVFSLVLLHLKFFREEAKDTGIIILKSVILAGIASFICIMGLFFSGILLIVLFSLIMPLWLSVLIVVFSYFLVSLSLAVYVALQLKKIAKKAETLVNETSKTLEESQIWLEQLKF